MAKYKVLEPTYLCAEGRMAFEGEEVELPDALVPGGNLEALDRAAKAAVQNAPVPEPGAVAGALN